LKNNLNKNILILSQVSNQNQINT